MTIAPELIADLIARLRETQPLVQCITNTVVTNWTANVLLAAGAAPAMVDNQHEAKAFAEVASAVLVNTGTPYEDTVAAMWQAVAGAAAAGTPWVLDPVAAGALAWRTEVATELMSAAAPAVVRGNASEISGLAGAAGGRGVDSAHSIDDVAALAGDLARTHGTVVAVSGPVDLITDGERVVRVHNGHPMMTRVTGVGCSLGALMAGFAAVTEDAVLAATAATGLLTVAAERAMTQDPGPGTFAVRLLDALALDPSEIAAALRLS
ncbi:MAG: hydroxyethylthiazole kinase [Propionibacteriaceae bacterium]|nr:hydroxyethylthiazole kinase [Propionibacteriaceae bacterium]